MSPIVLEDEALQRGIVSCVPHMLRSSTASSVLASFYRISNGFPPTTGRSPGIRCVRQSEECLNTAPDQLQRGRHHHAVGNWAPVTRGVSKKGVRLNSQISHVGSHATRGGIWCDHALP